MVGLLLGRLVCLVGEDAGARWWRWSIIGSVGRRWVAAHDAAPPLAGDMGTIGHAGGQLSGPETVDGLYVAGSTDAVTAFMNR